MKVNKVFPFRPHVCILAILLCTLFLPKSVLAQESTARYSLTFASTWSNETHPHANFPSSAHFSALIGATHNDAVSFWTPGETATDGIEQMAETGGTSLLRGEIDVALQAGTVHTLLSGPGLGSTPGQVMLDEFVVSRDFPLLTLVTMIAPSPDWFVGIHDLSLLDEEDNWRDQITVELYPYDAGSDSGTDYTSANVDTQPRELIASLRGGAPFSGEPIGTLTLVNLSLQYQLYLPIIAIAQ